MDFDKSKGYVFFIRHGQTDWNLKKLMQGRDQIPLNETGIAQANSASLSIKEACLYSGIKISGVYSSPLSRAEVTGKAISNALACPFYTDDRLLERDFGEFSGKPYTFDCPAILRDVPEIKGLEPVKSAIDRINSFVLDIVKPGKIIIAVTHGSITRIFAEAQKRSPRVDNFDTVMSNCHMVLYSFDGDEIIMEGYNIAPENLNKFI